MKHTEDKNGLAYFGATLLTKQTGFMTRTPIRQFWRQFFLNQNKNKNETKNEKFSGKFLAEKKCLKKCKIGFQCKSVFFEGGSIYKNFLLW